MRVSSVVALLAAVVFVAGLAPLRPAAGAAPRLLRDLQPSLGTGAGESNITTAVPPVPRPDTKPCQVTLFKNLAFEDYNPKPFSFTPAAQCPGPWAKVVLVADLSVSAGIQYDRTATIGIGGANIYFGTTAEPSPGFSPAWRVESDLTDLSVLFGQAQSGQVLIGNTVNGQYTGIIYASAKLQFYPPDTKYPAPIVPDIVVPLADSNGNPVGLGNSTTQLTASFVPPTNVERVYLDVLAQSQSTDEFWYTCVPNNLAQQLNNCGNTSFREAEAAMDGKPAGVAPIYPWIYSGGIDPYLWTPIPGVQTLDFVPYRVDLTPFAGTLENGASHQVALSVFNADNYFSVTGNLLLYLDHGAQGPLTGALDEDTLTATPPEHIGEHGTFNPTGTIETDSTRKYTLIGHLKTSQGFVRTQVHASLGFFQHMRYVNGAVRNGTTVYAQDITQDTAAATQTSVNGKGGGSIAQSTFDYPLALSYVYTLNSNGTAKQRTLVQQGYVLSTSSSGSGVPNSSSYLSNMVAPQDTLELSGGGISGFKNNASSQTYQYSDSNGSCYGRRVTERMLAVTSDSKIGCK
jgi:hypothetical protein